MTARWELIDEPRGAHANDTTVRTHRLRVPGGWLYRTVASINVVAMNGRQAAISADTVFVADPNPEG